MMNRRNFLGGLAALPVVGRFVPKAWATPKPETKIAYFELSERERAIAFAVAAFRYVVEHPEYGFGKGGVRSHGTWGSPDLIHLEASWNYGTVTLDVFVSHQEAVTLGNGAMVSLLRERASKSPIWYPGRNGRHAFYYSFLAD